MVSVFSFRVEQTELTVKHYLMWGWLTVKHSLRSKTETVGGLEVLNMCPWLSPLAVVRLHSPVIIQTSWLFFTPGLKRYSPLLLPGLWLPSSSGHGYILNKQTGPGVFRLGPYRRETERLQTNTFFAPQPRPKPALCFFIQFRISLLRCLHFFNLSDSIQDDLF